MDPWVELDEWCDRQMSKLGAELEKMREASGYKTDLPDYRCLLGQHIAFHRMRSYISGARKQAA